MKRREDLIVIAKSYMGAKGSDAQGMRSHYNRYCVPLVKPARRYEIQREDNWCAMFTSVVASLAGYVESEFPFEVSVGEQVKIARANGTFITDWRKALSGDLVIFDWTGKGWPSHVGFVDTIVGNVLHTIEGNKEGKVADRWVNLPNAQVMGFIRT